MAENKNGPFLKLSMLRQERARAMEAYVRVEQSLSDLYSALLGIQPVFGGIVFFKITNANARDKIMETLLKRKLGDSVRTYWHGDSKGTKGLFTSLGQLNIDRNKLAHWNVVNFLNGEARTMPGPEAGSWRLEPPNWWDMDGDKPFMTTEDIQEFSAKADFIQHSVFIFMGFNFSPPLPQDVRQAWQEIFGRPFLYPPPADHPSFARWQARENPLPPLLP